MAIVLIVCMVAGRYVSAAILSICPLLSWDNRAEVVLAWTRTASGMWALLFHLPVCFGSQTYYPKRQLGYTVFIPLLWRRNIGVQSLGTVRRRLAPGLT